MNNMKKRISIVEVIIAISLVSILLALIIGTTGCSALESEVDKVSYNVSQDADNFNVVRRLTVLNARTDKPMFELVGNFSIQTDNEDGQLEVICETGKNEYKKHFIRLNEWTMYVVEDIGGANVNKYKYEVNFFPEMIQPIDITHKD